MYAIASVRVDREHGAREERLSHVGAAEEASGLEYAVAVRDLPGPLSLEVRKPPA